MLIVEDGIGARGLVTPKSQIQLKNSTCDLTVGRLLPMANLTDSGRNKHHPQNWFILEPNHMVYAVSTQSLRMPDDVTGIATLVTSLTKKGILCLNVGIVDPGYEGKLSAVLVNFSKQNRKIEIGDRLFRVLFIKHKKIKKLKPWKNDSYTYLSTLKQSANEEFFESFLDIKGLYEAARNEARSVFWFDFRLKWLPYISLALGIISLGVAYWAGVQAVSEPRVGADPSLTP